MTKSRVYSQGQPLATAREPSAPSFRVDAALLIPGRGQPLEHASLVTKAAEIAWVGPTCDIPREFTSLEPVWVPALMPGMWDCHVHFMGLTSYDLPDFSVKPAVAGARAVRDMAATLDAGFTSVRELAGYGIEVQADIAAGWLKGPNIYSAASIISMTAGHDDLRDNAIEVNKSNSLRGGPLYVADGPQELLQAVRMQVRRGAKLIKIATSGGVGSTDSMENVQFSPQEIETVVSEAARNNLIVAAHCHGAAGIKTAIRGGCRTVEHVSFADEECIELMKAHGVTIIATRTLSDYGVHHPEMFSPDGYEKLKRVNEASKKSYARAIRAGVRCALGTDIALSTPTASLRHGANGREFSLAVEAGMSPLQAIEAGTANAPATLGPQAPMSGQLRPGYDADFIALSESPLDDITVLQHPEKIIRIWKGGVVMK